MAETTQVSVTDLSRVVRAAEIAAAGVVEVNRKADVIANDVSRVENKVEVVKADLAKLQAKFNAFVKEQRNANALQLAVTEIVRVTQALEDGFGNYELSRTRLLTILSSTDSGMLREHVISSCSEQIMMDTPDYWLAPCLVALAAWISDHEDLAKEAVTEAIRRNAEKATLLFALVCSRATPKEEKSGIPQDVVDARQAACLNFLSRYFDTQDPEAMSEGVLTVVNAWANNLFGKDKKNICGGTFVNWMNVIKKKDGFADAQKAEWKSFYAAKAVSTRETYANLAAVAPEFPAADAYLSRINSADAIQHHFDNIRFAKVNVEDMKKALDVQLANLISDLDPSERKLRNEKAKYEKIKEYKGDEYNALRSLKRASKQTKVCNFAERLLDAVRSDDPKNAAARKTAIQREFLGSFIEDAYKEYITENKDAFPSEITLKHNSFNGWTGKSKDGKNKDELTKSYTDHINKKREADVAAVSSKAKGFIPMLILAVLAAVLGIAASPVFFAGTVILAILAFVSKGKAKKAADAKIAQINQNYDQQIATGKKLILSVLDQWAAVLAKVAAFAAVADQKGKLVLEVPEEDK